MTIGRDGTEVLDVLYSAAADPAEWPTAITAVADHLGALGGMLVRNTYHPEQSSCIVGRISPEIAALYVRDYTDNPWTRAAASVPVGEIAVLSELYDLREGRHLSWYADILQPTGIRDMAYLSLPGFTSASSVGGIAFCFSESGAHEVQDAAHKMRQLRPHLKRSVMLSQRAEQARSLNERFHDLLNSSPRPVFLLSATGEVVGTNPAAETFMRQHNGGLLIDPSLHMRSASTSDDAPLQAAILRVLMSARAGRTLQVSLPIGPFLRTRLSALPWSAALPAPHSESEPAAMITIIDSHTSHDDKIPALVEIYGLTPAEARVAALLATGIGRKSAAERLHISVDTIKKHTAACFRKIDVTSQPGLAQAVATLPI